MIITLSITSIRCDSTSIDLITKSSVILTRPTGKLL
ncbi:hypothetical protein [Salmonella phage vB_SenS_SB10]|uniref:Uncharacterized protein n=1 Tax=Salmonella phage vB_SenS_SB10 TaxID=2591134 RepID=A0A5J6T998_9CAUD|nr:hypothetical protein [Salmonella phage vB_SenS_SB10]